MSNEDVLLFELLRALEEEMQILQGLAEAERGEGVDAVAFFKKIGEAY